MAFVPVPDVRGLLEEETAQKPKPGAYYALAILTLINTLNWCDRYVPSSTKEYLKEDFKLSDAETSYSIFVFIVVFMFTAPVFGTLSDYGVSRRLLLAIGIVTWSLAAASAYFATSLGTFLLGRAVVGVGEASFATITPALLADLFPPHLRSRALMVFYFATPVGAALGFILGGQLGKSLGWRNAYLLTGLPGLAIAGLVYFIRDPGLGAFEPPQPQEPIARAIKLLLKNKVYRCLVLGDILITFGIGGLADWMPTYMKRSIPNTDLAQASWAIGIVTVVGGLGGTSIGGFVVDWLSPRTRQPFLAACCLCPHFPVTFRLSCAGVAVISAAIVFSPVLLIHEFWTATSLILLAEILYWINVPPASTNMANVTAANIRTRAFSINIFLAHLLGDATSPYIIGAVSDWTGGNLDFALVLIPLTMGAGALVFCYGWLFLEDPTAPSKSPGEVELLPRSAILSGREGHQEGGRGELLDSEAQREFVPLDASGEEVHVGHSPSPPETTDPIPTDIDG